MNTVFGCGPVLSFEMLLVGLGSLIFLFSAVAAVLYYGINFLINLSRK